jgi:hypothetical protein
MYIYIYIHIYIYIYIYIYIHTFDHVHTCPTESTESASHNAGIGKIDIPVNNDVYLIKIATFGL